MPYNELDSPQGQGTNGGTTLQSSPPDGAETKGDADSVPSDSISKLDEKRVTLTLPILERDALLAMADALHDYKDDIEFPPVTTPQQHGFWLLQQKARLIRRMMEQCDVFSDVVGRTISWKERGE